MRVPKPRLRQVFEHSTHFKVTQPGANPIKIAKQGLSPGLHAKLRAFAEGGEVRNYDDGGNVTEPADAVDTRSPDEILAEFKQAEAAPRVGDVAIPQRKIEFATKPGGVAPLQTGGIEELPSRPPVQGVEEAERLIASLTPEEVAAAPAPVVPAAPVVVTPPAAPVVPPVAATVPVAVPVEKTVEIKLPDVVEITPEAMKKALDLNPGVEASRVAEALVAKVEPSLEGIALKLPERPAELTGSALERFDKAAADKAAALVDQAKSDFQEKQDLAKIAQQAEARGLQIAADDKARADALAQRKENLQKAYEAGFHPKSFWGSLSTPQQIGSTIALAVGGFLSGATNTPNYVYAAFNKAIDRDLDVQEKNYNSILKQYERVLGDSDAAEKLTRADLMNLSAMQVKTAQARADLRAVSPQLARLSAEFDMEAAKLREDVRKKMADADIAQAQAATEEELRKAKAAKLRQPPAGRGAAVFANLDLRKQNQQWKQEERAKSKTWSVPDPADPSKRISIVAPSPTAANSARTEMENRFTALKRVEELDKELSQMRASGADFSPQAVRKLATQMVGVVETYPSLLRGSKALVTQAQAKLLKSVVEDTPIPYLRYTDLFGATHEAIGQMRKDATDGFASAVQSFAEPNDPGAAQFAATFTPAGYRAKPSVVRSTAPSSAAGLPPTPSGMIKVRAKNGQIGLIPAANLQEALNRGATVVQ